VILRTRPRARFEQWYATESDPHETLRRLYRPTSVLWDGTTTWVLLEGHPDDVGASARAAGLREAAGPPELPRGGRWSIAPSALDSLHPTFVAEVGVGVVHHAEPPPPVEVSDGVRLLNRRIKENFDPTGRLNPGLDVLAVGSSA
jgi:hypothetical protein